MLNHAPLFATLGGVLLFAWALLRASRELTRVGLVCLVLAGLVAVPVFLSGEPAEERIEHAAGVRPQSIERHEDAARVTLALIVATALAAASGLVLLRRRAEVGRFAIAILVLGLLAIFQTAWTAHLGGGIRHPELTNPASADAQPSSETPVEHD